MFTARQMNQKDQDQPDLYKIPSYHLKGKKEKKKGKKKKGKRQDQRVISAG